MAIMIPSKIEDYKAAKKAHEDEIFNALQAIDDNNLYVFHSYKTLDLDENNVLEEHEIDFIIFHKNLGLIFMESKASDAGDIYFDKVWKYGDGKPMNHNPFRQAEQNKWNVIEKAQKDKLSDVRKIISFTKGLHCVCFPTMTDTACNRLKADGNYSRKLVISKNDLETPEKTWRKLNEIADIKLPNEDRFHNLTDNEAKFFIDNFLCPHVGAVSSFQHIDDSQNYSFNRLLDLQIKILEFLELENSVVITGGAGTGKTVVAVEKARRLAANNENVLFLCFNRELKHRLEKYHPFKNVHYFTLSGFILALTGSLSDFDTAIKKIEDFYFNNELLRIGQINYKHVIIDEGQDFGNTDDGDNITSKDEISIRERLINTLNTLILERDGCFYVFYDKQQLIQSKSIPKFINDADSRLALRRNVRNTENIGKAALKTISDKRCYIPNTIQGDPPAFYFIDANQISLLTKKIDSSITKHISREVKDIVIITLGTIESSSLYRGGKIVTEKENNYDNYYYKTIAGNKIMFTTCRKFKGCEADAVILVDVNVNSFKKDLYGNDTIDNFIYYVGASRAKKSLEVYTTINESECSELLPLLNERFKKRKSLNVIRDFTNSLGGILNE